MKKLLALALTLASFGFVASSAEAKTAGSTNSSVLSAVASAPQWQNRGRWNRRNNMGRARVYTQTRLVRYGRAVYRETYQIRALPNGRTVTRLISRVRVR